MSKQVIECLSTDEVNGGWFEKAASSAVLGGFVLLKSKSNIAVLITFQAIEEGFLGMDGPPKIVV